MKALYNIANLILVRDNLNSILNGFGKLSKEDKTNIQQKLDLFNKVILEQSLKLDVSDIEEKQIPITRGFTVSSTEDTEVVMKKFMQPMEGVVKITEFTPVVPTTTCDFGGLTSQEITTVQQFTADIIKKTSVAIEGTGNISIVSTEPIVLHNDSVISTTGYKYPIQQIINETKSE